MMKIMIVITTLQAINQGLSCLVGSNNFPQLLAVELFVFVKQLFHPIIS